jgi:uncharacterized membrane protein YfcA
MLLLAGAGFVAGAMNVVVGAGSLLTFPTLLLLGHPPLVANVSNTLGLVPGGLSGAVGYRRELAGQARRLAVFGLIAGVGALAGGALLLVLPDEVFAEVVPALLAVACLLVLLQPRISRWLVSRGATQQRRGPALAVGVFLTGIYGGYFGAAIGVLLLGLLGLGLDDDLQRLNALKVGLTTCVNAVAAVLFALVAPVAWTSVLVLAVASIVGGQVGAALARRIPAQGLRIGTAVIGLAVALRLQLS